MSAPRDFLTPREVAQRVGVSYHSVLRAIRRGELEAFEVVGRLRIEVTEYERWTHASPSRPISKAPNSETPARRPRKRPSQKASFAAELKAVEREVA